MAFRWMGKSAFLALAGFFFLLTLKAVTSLDAFFALPVLLLNSVVLAMDFPAGIILTIAEIPVFPESHAPINIYRSSLAELPVYFLIAFWLVRKFLSLGESPPAPRRWVYIVLFAALASLISVLAQAPERASHWLVVLAHFAAVLRLTEYHSLFPLRAFLTLFEGLLLFLMVVSEIKPADLKRITPLLTAGLAIVTLYGFADFFAIDRSGYFRGLNRAQSLYPNPNFLAAYLAALIPVVYPKITKGGWGLLNACLAAAAAALLVLTFSRGAWAAALCSLCLCALFDRTQSGFTRRAKIVGGLLALVLMLQCAGTAAFSFDPSARRFLSEYPGLRRILSPVSLSEPVTESLSGRAGIWEVSVRAFCRNWPTGLGIGRFFRDFSRYYDSSSPAPRWALHQNSHNFLLQVGVELGVLGLAPLLIFFGVLYSHGIRTALRERGAGEALFLVSFLAGLTALLLHSMVEHIFLYPRQMSYLWFLAAAIVVLSRGRAASLPENGGLAPYFSSSRLLAWGSAALLLTAALNTAFPAGTAGSTSQERIRSRAERIWRQQGEQKGREKEHWLQAEEEAFFGIGG